jgi:leader peptidase (prepilin peptidase)/N-methyltransferase
MFDAAYYDIYPIYIFTCVMTFFLGTCIGSFLNVCIYRIPRELSTVTPRSHCPHCNKLIPWYLNIPILSYIMLLGKCRFCGKHITCRYVLVELLTGVLFLLIALKFQIPSADVPFFLVAVADWKLIPIYWLVVSGLILGTFVDFEHLIIPDRVTLGGIAAGLLLSAIVPSIHLLPHELHGSWIDHAFSLMWSVVGASTGWFILWGTAILGKIIFRKDAMGFGDVKLLGAIGAFLGWKAVFCTILVSSFTGSIVGITLVFCKCKQMQSKIPFGPYIALGAIVWMLWGQNMLDGYIEWMTPDEFPFKP